MSEQPSPTPAPVPPPPRVLHAFLNAFGLWYHRFHRFDRAKAHTHHAHLYAITVAVGVPLMGWLIQDFYLKLFIAMLWFAVVPVFYFWLGGVEIDSQIKRFGLLDQQESDYQRKTMYFLYFGVIFALVVWVLALAIYIAVDWPGTDWSANTKHVFGSVWATPVYYGFVEWAILSHTVLVGYLTIDIYFPLISNYLQATSGQRRIEREEPIVPH